MIVVAVVSHFVNMSVSEQCVDYYFDFSEELFPAKFNKYFLTRR